MSYTSGKKLTEPQMEEMKLVVLEYIEIRYHCKSVIVAVSAIFGRSEFLPQEQSQRTFHCIVLHKDPDKADQSIKYGNMNILPLTHALNCSVIGIFVLSEV